MREITDISRDTRIRVRARDSIEGTPCCIYCGSPRNIELAHFVSRARGGMGKESNLACLCERCHKALDNGADIRLRNDIKEVFEWWLKDNYPGWSEEDQIYKGKINE